MGEYQPEEILDSISNDVRSGVGSILNIRRGHELEFTDRYGNAGILSVRDADDVTIQQFNIVVTELDGGNDA